jgi:hypothetical protein
MNRGGKSGWYPGQGNTFTPFKDAEWCDDFNEMLPDYKSRNELTHVLIEEGIKSLKGQSTGSNKLTIDLSGFTKDEVELINSEQGQVILRNIFNLMTGKGNPLAAVTPVKSGEDKESHPPVEEIQNEKSSKNKHALDFAKRIHKGTNIKK